VTSRRAEAPEESMDDGSESSSFLISFSPQHLVDSPLLQEPLQQSAGLNLIASFSHFYFVKYLYTLFETIAIVSSAA